MREISRHTKNPKKKFYDKNGDLIKLGDKLNIPNKDKLFYKDLVVVEEDGLLGLLFVHYDFFIPLNTLLNEFFRTCEIIKNNDLI